MAVEAKAGMLDRIGKEIAADVTAEAMPRILAKIADMLVDYDVSEKPGASTAEMDDVLDYYLSSMRVKGLSEKSVAHYEYLLRRILTETGVPCQRMTVHHLRGWLAKEKNRGISDLTLRGDRSVMSAFFGWVHREGLIEKNPVANLDPIKCAKKTKKIYSAVDMEKLQQAAAKETRDRAILSFLATTGCRVGELVRLNRDSVDLNSGEATVHGKGNKERIVYMGDVTAMLLKQYLAERKDSSEALFVSLRGQKRLQAGGVRVMLNGLAMDAHVEHVHPHKFRRTFATNAARRGMPIQEVAALLGHEKIDTTMAYVNISREDIKHDYKRLT